MDKLSLGDFFPVWMLTFPLSLLNTVEFSFFSALPWRLAALSKGAQFWSNLGATLADWSRGLRSQRSASRMALL